MPDKLTQSKLIAIATDLGLAPPTLSTLAEYWVVAVRKPTWRDYLVVPSLGRHPHPQRKRK